MLGILQASGLPCSPPGILPNQGIEISPPASLALQADSLSLSHQGSPRVNYTPIKLLKKKKEKKKEEEEK